MASEYKDRVCEFELKDSLVMTVSVAATLRSLWVSICFKLNACYKDWQKYVWCKHDEMDNAVIVTTSTSDGMID